jgi:hypothetical protein
MSELYKRSNRRIYIKENNKGENNKRGLNRLNKE